LRDTAFGDAEFEAPNASGLGTSGWSDHTRARTAERHRSDHSLSAGHSERHTKARAHDSTATAERCRRCAIGKGHATRNDTTCTQRRVRAMNPIGIGILRPQPHHCRGHGATARAGAHALRFGQSHCACRSVEQRQSGRATARCGPGIGLRLCLQRPQAQPPATGLCVRALAERVRDATHSQPPNEPDNGESSRSAGQTGTNSGRCASWEY